MSGVATKQRKGVGTLSRVRETLPELSSTMAKIAEVVLADPAALLERSITDLAAEAGTSAATVTRFCRLMGYSGYVQFRVGLAADLGHADAHDSWRADIGREFDPQDPPADILRTLLKAQVEALNATAMLVDVHDVTRIAKMIWSSSHLDLYGVVGSAALADEFKGRLYRIGINAHCWSEIHLGLASAAILPKDAVAIGISRRGTARETVEMLSRAKKSGAYTVAVTGDRRSPLGRTADACIVTATPMRELHSDDVSAKVAQLFVLDLLYLLIAQQDLVAAAERLASTRLAVAAHHRRNL